MAMTMMMVSQVVLAATIADCLAVFVALKTVFVGRAWGDDGDDVEDDDDRYDAGVVNECSGQNCCNDDDNEHDDDVAYGDVAYGDDDDDDAVAPCRFQRNKCALLPSSSWTPCMRILCRSHGLVGKPRT